MSTYAEQFVRYIKKILARTVLVSRGEAQPPIQNVPFWVVPWNKSGGLTLSEAPICPHIT